MVDFSKLNNLTTLTYDTSNLTESSQAIETLINNSDTATGGYFGLGVLLVSFIILTFMIYRDDGDIRLDILRSMLISSGFIFIIGIFGLVLNIFSNYTHVLWFAVIFIVSLISVYYLKKKNL